MRKLLIILGIIVILAFGFLFLDKNKEMTIGAGTINRTTSAATTIYTIGPDNPVSILATSTGRQLVHIAATTSNVYVIYNGSTDTSKKEYITSPLVFDLDRLYTGAIAAGADTASTTISVTVFGN